MRSRPAVAIDRPIFFVGMPRSGTTVLFEAFAAHRDVAWFSQYHEWRPAFPKLALLARTADLSSSLRRSVSRSDQGTRWLDRIRVGPSEAYGVWERCCGEKFRYDYLLGTRASMEETRCLSDTVSQVMRYQGKPRFAAKITGPARIGYLSSIFDDARFVHVVRDGRAVVQSLMGVAFWKQRHRMHEPAWSNGLLPADDEAWLRSGRSPLALAAVQWRRVVESAREEAARLPAGRYVEVHYEQFVDAPDPILDEITSFCGLPPSARAKAFLRGRFDLKNMNFQWMERFSVEEIAMLNDLLGPTLASFGYPVDSLQFERV